MSRALACAVLACWITDARCDPTLSISSRPPPIDAGLDGDSNPRPPGCDSCVASFVSAGAEHTCALVDGAVHCFGRARARFADGPAISSVEAGSLQTCVARYDAVRLYSIIECDGVNLRGLLFADSEATHASEELYNARRSVATLHLAAAHAVMHADDRFLLWGDNRYGQLGGATSDPYAAAMHDAGMRGVPHVAAGGTATCAINRLRRAVCSGVFPLTANALATWTPEEPGETLSWPGAFELVPDVPENVIAISVGMAHGCAIDELGAVWCWGANLAGESGALDAPLDRARRIDLPAPALAISAGGAHAVHVESPVSYRLEPPGAGRAHTCAILGDELAKELWCWGDNTFGQLGAGPVGGGPEPQQVPVLFPTMISAGGAHTCALNLLGEIWCWGDNTHGQLGLAAEDVSYSNFPRRVSFTAEAP